MIIILILNILKINLFLGQSDWLNYGITLVDNEQKKNVKLPLMSDFHSVFQVVFVDSSGYLNLCSNVFKSNYIHVSYIFFLTNNVIIKL